MPVSETVWITSIIFGAVLGWVLGRHAPDHGTTIGAVAMTSVIGVVVWLTGPSPGTDPAVAAVSMTFGGASSLLFIAALGRRPSVDP